MSTDFDIDQIDAQYLRNSEQVIMDAVRKTYPRMDLRPGTALRETVVNTDAVITAYNRNLADELRQANSLLAAEADMDAPATTIAGVLANYGVTPRAGTRATGYVRITLNQSTAVVIPASTVFTNGEHEYTLASTVTARLTPYTDELPLIATATGQYTVTVPVAASEVGSEYNLPVYTVLESSWRIQALVDIVTITEITGGSAPESVQQAIERIPQALSYRSANSQVSVGGLLAAGVPVLAETMLATSVCGMGDAAQRRDMRNPLGVSVGGKIDVYLRTFAAPQLHAVAVTAARNSDGTYSFTVGPHNTPPFCTVVSVGDDISTASSYDFTTAITGVSRAHGLDGAHPADAAFSKYQTQTITVRNAGYTEDTREFYAVVWLAPGIDVAQDYLDSAAVKQANADVLVRAPVLCHVSGTFAVEAPVARNLTADVLQRALMNYVNTRHFVGKLSRAELTATLIGAGVSHVQLLPDASTIRGVCVGADGTRVEQVADIINIDNFAQPNALITPKSVVFVATPESFTVTVTQR